MQNIFPIRQEIVLHAHFAWPSLAAAQRQTERAYKSFCFDARVRKRAVSCKAKKAKLPRDTSDSFLTILRSAENAEQHARRYSRTDNAGHIRAHRVHEKEVAGVLLLSDLIGDAGSHRNSRYTG